MPALNPFWHAGPVPLEKFMGRNEEIHNIMSRISTGQSTAIIGSACSGKTSVLQYLLDPSQLALYGDRADQLIFSHLDVSTWGEQFDWVQFWKAALHPLYEQIQQDETSALYKAYQICRDNDFGDYVVERLLIKLKAANKQLVLVIDDFDTVLRLPLRKSAQFFGSMRSLTTRSQDALSVVIAINTSLRDLTNEVGKSTNTGSPYFNYMNEVVLMPLSDHEIDNLLNQATTHFSKEDCTFIKDMAGGHPYLLQTLASCLWALYQRPELSDPKQRQQQATKDFYSTVTEALERIWGSWQLTTQQVMMAVTFAQLDKLKWVFQRQGINVESISQQIPRLKSELESLKRQGFVAEDGKVAGGWRVFPKIFLHFIIDKQLELKYREKLPPEVWKTLLTPDFG